MDPTALDRARATFHAHVVDLQDRITDEIRRLDPAVHLVEDPWTRTDPAGDEGGGGRTRAFADGDVFESAGVNTSLVYGALDPAFAGKLGGASGDRLWAAGISLILHPRSPRVPTTHMNFRMVSVGAKTWFGGGADLTPFWPHTDDFRQFHGTWKSACEPLGTYDAWKAWCDRYFTNTHRDGEMRGIGGVFFDHLVTTDPEVDGARVRALSEHFVPSYFPIVERRRDEAYTPEDEDFMLWRRGRYVEFNLLHDRGTHFGLATNGRTDSILISLPARVRFAYRYAPPEGTPHAEMMRYYRPFDWV